MPTKLICLLPLLGALAAAQTMQSPLKLTLSNTLVTTVTENGRTVERLKANPASVLPGQVVLQTLKVTNTGKTQLKAATVRLPVPKNTAYAGALRSASGATPQFSFDGGKTFAPAPLKRRVTVTENGKAVTREVDVNPSEYTDVRWTINTLAPGQSVELSYRVNVR